MSGTIDDATRRRVHALRLKEGTAIGAYAKDLELSAGLADDEETRGLVNPDSFLMRINERDRARLRVIVKNVHLKHHPLHMITDLEADRVIEAMGPRTQESLIRKAVEHGLFT
jgi:hypothetical protein